MNKKELLKSIFNQLVIDLEKANDLKELLLEEKTYLDSFQHEKLQETTGKKLQLMEHLSEGEIRRQQSFKECDIEIESDTARELIFQLSQESSPKLIETWDQYHDLLTEIKRLHDINGQIIHMANQQAERILNVILERDNQNTYDAKGYCVHGKNTSKSIKA